MTFAAPSAPTDEITSLSDVKEPFLLRGRRVSVGSAMINDLSMLDTGQISEQQAACYISVLLGRSDGGPLYQFGDDGEFLDIAAAGTFRGNQCPAGADHHAKQWRGGHAQHHCDRPVELDHVSYHFRTRHQAARAADHGDSGRRSDPVFAWYFCRRHWPAACLLSAAAVLPVHQVLRHSRLQGLHLGASRLKAAARCPSLAHPEN